MAAALSVPAAGFVFDDATGRLYEHTGRGVVVMLPWPALRAYTRLGGDAGWKSCLPEMPILARLTDTDAPPAMPSATARTATLRMGVEAVRRYSESIPPDVREWVAPYPDRHWHLLRWLSRCGSSAEDLCDSNPALAYMVASGWEFGSDRERRACEPPPIMLAYRKQRHILGWLGFPPTEGLRHVTRKIKLAALTIPRLVALRRRVLLPEVAKRLAHVSCLNAGVLEIAGDASLLSVTPRLLEAISRLPDSEAADLARTITDTVRMWRAVRRRERLPVFADAGRIGETHDELAVEVNRRGLGTVSGDLPDAPVPGTEAILPITSREMLAEEGRCQHNCVGSYASRVAIGRMAIYRVLEPERATLSLAQRAGRWHIDQLKGPCNRPVGEHTRSAVRAWLAASLNP
jgi:hypothetical protein